VEHAFQIAANACEEICQQCGLKRTVPHDMQDGVCLRCGKNKDEVIQDYQKEITAVSPAQSNYAVKCEIERIANNYKGIGDSQLLYPLCQAYAQSMMGIFEEYWLLKNKLHKAGVFVSDAYNVGKALVSQFLMMRIQAFVGNKDELNIPFFYIPDAPVTPGAINPKSGSYYSFEDNISNMKKKDYTDSPFAFFKTPSLDFLGLVHEEEKQTVFEYIYNHAVSWVNEAMD